jgi:hypothetical protein
MTQGFASLNGVALTVINSQQRVLGSRSLARPGAARAEKLGKLTPVKATFWMPAS